MATQSSALVAVARLCRGLPALLLFVVLSARAPGQNTSNLELSNPVSYQYGLTNPDTLTLTGTITNPSNGGTSGSIRLELWVFPEPYSGGSVSGTQMGFADFQPLKGGNEYANATATVAATNPYSFLAFGNNYPSLLLTEYTGTGSDDGYVVDSYINFPSGFSYSEGYEKANAEDECTLPNAAYVAPPATLPLYQAGGPTLLMGPSVACNVQTTYDGINPPKTAPPGKSAIFSRFVSSYLPLRSYNDYIISSVVRPQADGTLATGIRILDGTDAAASNNIELYFTSSTSGNYYSTTVYGSPSVPSSGTFTLVYQPVIQTPSDAQTVVAGSSAIFSVAVSGTGPFTYQWYLVTPNVNGGSYAAIPGATGSSYTVASAGPSNAGRYAVLVSNSAGGVLGQIGTLAVTALESPFGFSPLAGGGQYFTGSADGTGSAARFNEALGVAVDIAGNVYVADFDNDEIRMVSPAGVVTTLAGLYVPGPGGQGVAGYADGIGSAARFAGPSGVAVDSAGNLYVADTYNNLIRKITPTIVNGATTWVVSTLAGVQGRYGGYADGTGSAAQFQIPEGIAVDSAGNLLVGDTLNNVVRKITPTVVGGATTWVVTTLAGKAGKAGTTDGTGGGALFSSPCGVAVDGTGNVYVADSGNNTIREISATGVVTTLAGKAGQNGWVDGTGTAALFSSPFGVAVAGGTVYVGDTINERIRTVSAAGVVSTVAGVSNQGYNTDGVGTALQFSPWGMAVDSGGNVYVAAYYSILKGNIATGPSITVQPSSETVPPGSTATFTVAATGFPAPTYQWQLNGVNLSDGKGTTGSTSATLNITGVTGSLDGDQVQCQVTNSLASINSNSATLNVSGTSNATSYAYAFTTIAGVAGDFGGTDGTGSSAYFYYPGQVAVDSAGNVYVAGNANDSIRELTPTVVGGATTWVVTTIAGSAGTPGSADGSGTAARFLDPTGVAVDTLGNVYVADYNNDTIREITPTMNGAGTTWTVTTIAGSAKNAGSSDGAGAGARFRSPQRLAVDSAGNVYVADTGNDTIREITPTMAGGSTSWAVTTIAGSAGSSGSADGMGSAARFNSPIGIATDSGGNVYVADYGNDAIRMLVPTVSGGITTWGVRTIAGTAGVAGSADGAGSAAGFSSPTGVALDGLGNVYVTDSGNSTIRKMTPTVASGATTWTVTTLAGVAGVGGSADGTGTAATFNSPSGLALDGQGDLYVADTNNDTIRLGTPLAKPFISAQPGPETAVGGVATFSIAVGGSPAPAFQWRVSTNGGSSWTHLTDGNGVTGSDTATLSLNGGIFGSNAYEFDCVVTNSQGSVISGAAVLTVTAPPLITTPPASQSVNAGSNLVLSVAASSGSAMTYQWFLGGTAIGGATGMTLSLGNVTVANSGTYTVNVTNSSGTSQSSAATLTVSPAPTSSAVSVQPTPQTIHAGGSVVFTVTTSGTEVSSLRANTAHLVADTAATTYQWQFNAVNLTDGNGITGSTGPQLLIQGTTAANDGDYDCVVTTGGTAYTSNAAGLQVETVSNPGSVSSISSRAFVGTGDNILIGGFYIVGSTSATVLVQAIGPALAAAPYNVSGTLQKPALTIHQAQNGKDVVLYSNTGWGSSPVLLAAAAAVYALPVLQPNAPDSEALLTLPPGGYTAEVTGADGGTGVALCGIYQMP
jgi:hypothetical protein